METLALIRSVVEASGLWDEGRGRSHGFLLSPEAYEISLQRYQELQQLGRALQEVLAGMGRISAIASNPKLTCSRTWRMIGRVLRTGIPAIYRPIQNLNPSRTPRICKVDLLETPDGYRIAEIDGHNKHGLGYSVLTAGIRKALFPERRALPGTAASIAKDVLELGETDLVLMYADQERFYLPEFKIFERELLRHGITLILVNEVDIKVVGGRLIIPGTRKVPRLWLDFPFLYHNPLLNDYLVKAYLRQKIDFLIPPKPFFGSKALLALVRNDSQDKELECILGSQIPGEALTTLRGYIPDTYLVHKNKKPASWRAICENKPHLLKETVSGGMKGTVFAEDGSFDAVFERACNSYYRFILQAEMSNLPMRFCWFDPNGEANERDWYSRITVHYTLRGIADVIVTARPDKKVHGAPDCLQLGAMFTA